MRITSLMNKQLISIVNGTEDHGYIHDFFKDRGMGFA